MTGCSRATRVHYSTKLDGISYHVWLIKSAQKQVFNLAQDARHFKKRDKAGFGNIDAEGRGMPGFHHCLVERVDPACFRLPLSN